MEAHTWYNEDQIDDSRFLISWPAEANSTLPDDQWLKCQAGVGPSLRAGGDAGAGREREFFIDNLLVRIHLITVMIRCTGLAPWEFEFPFPDSLAST